ncbi:anhydro-N-acetylmuramic acid kinase [Allobacillus sp. GCM10007491]|uniref:Anhydro-N-acetylmuramic acid kinase n=1 Tax=Allobacillus saliphilus TaxID=2912308 RepID=A0A941HRQ2_9BACI|nr:anhydro-N-acetylmuramic acid kinase [Allobacillus saliphilus]MBR7552623.1 anhydro-N-acetylmuramic acid kinase [Allobacillus saliphilus]
MSKLGIGLMSGTSLDGIDAVLCRVNGTGFETELEVLHAYSVAYTDDEKQKIMALCDEHTARVDDITAMNFYLAEKFSEAVLQLIEQSDYSLTDIDFVSSHGQTIYHLPDEGSTKFQPKSTLQIGDISVISERTGLPVVGDFRTADMAAGGQGAPLVSFLDYVFFKDEKKSRALQNIGGIGNVTYLGRGDDQQLTSFDTGPGNMVIDEVVYRLSEKTLTYDKNGQWAAKGQENSQFVEELMDHEYFSRKPPKTTGREVFGKAYVDGVMKRAKELDLSADDLVASVTAWTAKTIAKSYKDFILSANKPLDEVIVSGGGGHNETLLRYLQEYLPDQRVTTIDEFGISSDAKEAAAFVLFGYHFLLGETNTISEFTNADHEVIMGKLSYTQPQAFEKVLSIRGS